MLARAVELGAIRGCVGGEEARPAEHVDRASGEEAEEGGETSQV